MLAGPGLTEEGVEGVISYRGKMDSDGNIKAKGSRKKIPKVFLKVVPYIQIRYPVTRKVIRLPMVLLSDGNLIMLRTHEGKLVFKNPICACS